jgi:hypothetical protein
MAGPPLTYSPPSPTTGNVLYGLGLVFTAPQNTALPSDQNLGVGASWLSGGWSYIGATDAGTTLTWTPSVVDVSIEEQPTPVAKVVDKATFEVGFNFSEETLANINLAYGGAGSIAVTAPGAGQPGKSVLSLSLNFPTLACAVLGKNELGFATVINIPGVMSSGTVATSYRRAANQRLYPCTLGAVCAFSSIQWVKLTAIATS